MVTFYKVIFMSPSNIIRLKNNITSFCDKTEIRYPNTDENVNYIPIYLFSV